MNERSAVLPNKPDINIKRKQLSCWFTQQGGKQKSPKEKPLDTPELMRKRMIWAQKHFKLLTDPNIPVASLDEKWFYTTNRRRKIKYLPKGPHEREEDVDTSHPKIISRRFPVKAMFLGVVARPQVRNNFNGKILLERISQQEKVKRNSTNQNFSDDVIINTQIKSGEWKQYYVDGLTCSEFKVVIGATYGLEQFVIDRLELCYCTFIGDKGNNKWVSIKDHSDMKIEKIRDYPQNHTHFLIT